MSRTCCFYSCPSYGLALDGSLSCRNRHRTDLNHDGIPLDAIMRETENSIRLSCAPDNQMSFWWGERELAMSWLFYQCCRSRERLSVCLGLDPLSAANRNRSVPKRAAPEISHHILSNLERSCFEVHPAWNIQCFSIPENALHVWACPC
jgi:hypothetical protein